MIVKQRRHLPAWISLCEVNLEERVNSVAIVIAPHRVNIQIFKMSSVGK
jgi:hypothetical protein